MKKYNIIISIILLSVISCVNPNNKKIKTIGLTQFANHPSLNEVADGVKAGLKDLGWEEGKNLNIIFRNANRNPQLTLPIAESFVQKKVDVMVPITTPSAISCAKTTKKIPVVFVGVTDPIGVGLVETLDHGKDNVTGSSDKWPFRLQIELFFKLIPNIKKIGLLYSPGDDVSVIAVDELKKLQKDFNFELITSPLQNASDVYSAARQLLRSVDVIYTGTDNLIVENLSSVLKAANEANKPVFAGDEGTVQKGALATYGISMFDLGYESASIIHEVLNGKSPSKIPILIITKGKPIINKAKAKELGITIPENIKDVTFVN